MFVETKLKSLLSLFLSGDAIYGKQLNSVSVMATNTCKVTAEDQVVAQELKGDALSMEVGPRLTPLCPLRAIALSLVDARSGGFLSPSHMNFSDFI